MHTGFSLQLYETKVSAPAHAATFSNRISSRWDRSVTLRVGVTKQQASSEDGLRRYDYGLQRRAH